MPGPFNTRNFSEDVNRIVESNGDVIGVESDEEFDDTRIETPKLLRSELSRFDSKKDSSVGRETSPNSIRRFANDNSLDLDPFRASNTVESNRNRLMHVENKTIVQTPKIIQRSDNGSVLKDKPWLLISPNNKLIKKKEPKVQRRDLNDKLNMVPLEGVRYNLNQFSSPPSNLKIKQLKFPKSPLKPSQNRIQLQKFVVAKIDKDETQEDVRSFESEILNHGTANDSIKAPERSAIFHNVEKNESSRSVPKYSKEDISRASLLEKVNQTLESIVQTDAKGPSPEKLLHANVETELLENADGNLSDSSASASEELLRKLDFKYRHSSPLLEVSTPLVDDNSARKRLHARPIFDREAIQDIASPRRKDNIKLTNPEPVETLHSKSNTFELSLSKERNPASKSWTPIQWLKLNKIVLLKSITRQEAISSPLLMTALGCSTKVDLMQRYDFLALFNRFKSKQSQGNIGKAVGTRKRSKSII